MQLQAFVGRRRERIALARFLAAKDRRWTGCVVQGNAGIGKTRLVQEALDERPEPDHTLVHCSCFHIEEVRPYSLIIQILQQLDLSSEVLSLVSSPECDSPSRALELIEDVNLKRVHFVRLLSQAVVKATAQNRVIIRIDDVQWADAGSILVINNLLDNRVQNLRILCTQRTDEVADLDRQQLLMQLESKCKRIVLAGLSRDELGELADRILGVGTVTDDELRDLEVMTAGNPLFVRELLSHLGESGLLERHSISMATALSRTPRRLVHVLDLRLQSLPERDHRILTACAVYGGDYSSHLIARVTAESSDSVQSLLEAYAERGVLTQIDSQNGRRFRFGHPLYAARLYELASPEIRRQFHRAFACSAEAQLTTADSARHHALGLGTRGSRKAVRQCTKAAEEAEQVSAHETAAKFWELAVDSAPASNRRVLGELLSRQGRALWAAAKWDLASECWTRAAQHFEELGDSNEAGRVSAALGELYRWRQELPEAEQWLRRSISFFDEECQERTRSLALLGSILCLGRDKGAALDCLNEAIAESASGHLEPATALWLSYGFAAAGESQQAYLTASEGLENAQRRGAVGTSALLASGLVTPELCRLNLPAARRFARIVKDGLDPSDPRMQIRYFACQAMLLSYVGKWRGVERLSERWMAEARLAGRYQVATARLAWAEAQLALGQLLPARREIVAALPYLARMRPVGALYLAKVLLALGNASEAQSLVRRHARQIYDRREIASEVALLGDVVAQLEMPSLWKKCYELLAQEDRAIVVVHSITSVQRVLGRLAAKLKLWNDSIEHFEVSIQQLSNGNAQWELAQAYLAYAEMRLARKRRGDAKKARALRLQADDILESLGLERSFERRHQEAGPSRDRFALTGRELEILTLIAEGLRNQEIADTLTISRRTVERHLENCFTKMDVRSRAEAVVTAVDGGLIGPLVRTSNSNVTSMRRARRSA